MASACRGAVAERAPGGSGVGRTQIQTAVADAVGPGRGARWCVDGGTVGGRDGEPAALQAYHLGVAPDGRGRAHVGLVGEVVGGTPALVAAPGPRVGGGSGRVRRYAATAARPVRGSADRPSRRGGRA